MKLASRDIIIVGAVSQAHTHIVLEKNKQQKNRIREASTSPILTNLERSNIMSNKPNNKFVKLLTNIIISYLNRM